MHTALTITEVPYETLALGAMLPAFDHPAVSPEPFRPRVLCLSRDRLLGYTRRAILQRRYDAVFPGAPDNLQGWVHAFEVIVLCHTLSVEECQQAISNPAGLRAMIVFVASDSRPIQAGADRIVRGLAGPEALLRAVHQVLQPTIALRS